MNAGDTVTVTTEWGNTEATIAELSPVEKTASIDLDSQYVDWVDLRTRYGDNNLIQNSGNPHYGAALMVDLGDEMLTAELGSYDDDRSGWEIKFPDVMTVKQSNLTG